VAGTAVYRRVRDLGLLETLAIAKAIAHKTRQQLDYNRQCLAEGIGNLSSSFFQCIPGAGSLSRSAINHQAGAATKLSGVFTSLAVAVLVFAPLTRYIPKAVLAGLLIVAASRLTDIERLRYVTCASGYDALLLFGTTLVTLIVGVEYSISIGVLASVLLFVPRAARLKRVPLIVTAERIVRERTPGDPAPQHVALYDFEGERFFGAAPELEKHLTAAFEEAKSHAITHVVLRVKRLRNPDAVCLERLEHGLKDAQAAGFTILLAGLLPDLLAGIQRLGFDQWLPRECWFAEEDSPDSATLKAVRKAYNLLGVQHPDGAPGRLLFGLISVHSGYLLTRRCGLSAPWAVSVAQLSSSDRPRCSIS